MHADAARFAVAFGGRRVGVCSPQGRFVAGAAELDGRVLEEAEAHGKNLFLWFSGGLALHVHLGLIGAWTWWSAAGEQVAGPLLRSRAPGAVRVRLSGPDGVAAELRGAMTCQVLAAPKVEAVVSALGPDPIRADADPGRAWARISRSAVPLGTLLLDQKVVAGAGLIWRCEAPFLAGISPFRPGHAVSAAEWCGLWAELVRIMRAAVDHSADHGPTDGHTSEGPSVSFAVFRRAGQPCVRCGTPVESAPLAGRPVWWCPHHQPR